MDDDGDGPTRRPARLVTLCTGNAARSVMAGYMLEHFARSRGTRLEISTAGTHAIEGQPMSMRTRAAIAAIPDLAGVPTSAHRSRLLVADEAARSDLVVAMEADHVAFVRRRAPELADRTATIRSLARQLEPGPRPLAARVARLQLAEAPLDPADDVVDPAGGDDVDYVACARELWVLCGELAARL